MQPGDTHAYDGLMVNRFSILLKSVDQKDERVRVDLGQPILARETYDFSSLRKKLTPEAQAWFDLICQDWGLSPNYDPNSQIRVEHLMLLIYQIWQGLPEEEKTTLTDELSFQLTDLQTGPCPQGRSTRLYQLVFPFILDEDRADLI